MKVTVPARAAFLNVFEPKPFENGPPTYNGKFIIDPSDKATVQKLRDAMLQVAEAKWPGKGKQTFDKMVKTGKPKNIEVCFVEEPYANGDGDPYDGFEDMFYLSAKAGEDQRPLVIDRDRSPLLSRDGRPYSGSYVNVQAEIWAQSNNFGKGIRATMKGIQFVKDGDAFSGGAPASVDDFDDVTDGSDASGLA